MAKVKNKVEIGKKLISKLEVKSSISEQTNSFMTVDGTLHHNCNGPHCPLVVVDEIDTISGEGVRAFSEIAGMLDSRNGKKALRIGISTRKSRYGLMEQQISNAEKLGKVVRRWTALEFTERCQDSRSGVIPTDYYIDQLKFEVRTPEQYARLGVQKKKDFEKYTAYDKCATCPALPVCLGDAKNQKSTSPMLKTIDEMNQKILSEGPDWTQAQLFNLKPSVEGIVYKEFEERLHVKDWNQMWLTLTGKEFPGECDHDMFVKKCQDMGLPAYSGLDFGWSNPHTLVVFFVDNKENIYVVRCDGQTYISRPAWIHHVKNKWHHVYRPQLYFPDQGDPGDAVEMKKIGLPTSTNTAKGEVNTGIQLIKKWLRAPGTSEPKIFFAQETCGPIITEFLTYHFKTMASGEISDDPDTDSDHWLDALRYCFYGLFSKSTVIMSSAGLDLDTSKLLDKSGNFFKPPTPEEYAKVNNIPVGTEVDTSKLGKIGRLSELETDDDEALEGGFIWSM